MPVFSFLFRAMAAENELQLAAADFTTARRAAELAMGDVARIESKYSRYRDDSVTTRVNRMAGRDPVAIDAETAALLDYADHCHKVSGGLFDLTSGVLRRVWNFKRDPPQLPDPRALAACVALIDWSSVERTRDTVRLPRPGMELDFGGIGKEYAADRAASICIDAGIEHGLVNLAGDVRVIGSQENGEPWRVGIRHPREDGKVIGHVDAVDAAVATSGDYERFFELDGRRYCHILDPRSGLPVTTWQSVSVVAPLCVVAGSCSTIAMLLGEDAEAFLSTQEVQYVAVAADGSLHGTPLAGTRGRAARG
jgi:thiamine biosynthesis lipoprotein